MWSQINNKNPRRQVPVKLPRQVCSRVIPVPKPAPVVHHAVHQPVLTVPHHGLHHGDAYMNLVYSTSNMHIKLDLQILISAQVFTMVLQVFTMESNSNLSSTPPSPLVRPPIYSIQFILRVVVSGRPYHLANKKDMSIKPIFHSFIPYFQVLPIASSTLLASNTNCHQCNNLWSTWHYLSITIYSYLLSPMKGSKSKNASKWKS